MRVLFETMEISLSHSCAYRWIVMAIACACVGRDLYFRVSGGVSLKDTSCAISYMVRVWNFPVLLITMGII